MQRAHGNGKFFDVPGVGDSQSVLPHVFDVLGPRIDERHVLPGLHHVTADIPAHRARTDNCYPSRHAFLLHS